MLPPEATRPALPRALARRLDRLAFRAHAFHRWAHHPLCPAYAPEVIRIGRRGRLCRGCTFATLGVLAGILLGGLGPAASLPALLGAGALGILGASTGLARRRFPKLATRALPASLPPFLTAQALRHAAPAAWGLALLAWALAGGWVLVYRRRGPDRSPCATCPEASASPVCTGFRPIRARERAFARLASRWIRLESTAPGTPGPGAAAIRRPS